jgi:hypothetical protein
VHNDREEEKKSIDRGIERGRLAATKWLPMSITGAAIPFIIGVVMRLSVEQVLISVAMTGALVFSGLWMQSYGREKEHKDSSV